ncbi:Sodium/hydrogen exchanger family-domain-containing protein [Lactarius akahatsu]|uniref:Sodium/hydrogen exchanger family-domain-containing protein n=1 Tax=Lactarius akahatsu TaxID=416441 RepID=A0AAD4LIH1_9AGAM|nr:Sodium/hydrogen exchanger family-domain-containing protein [Lactarius akahatsu]
MPWNFLDSSSASVAYTLLGGFVVAYNLVSLVIKERLYMNEVILGTGFGVILGPHILDIFDPRSWTGVTDILTREIMRVVLATGLFAIGVDLPRRYMAEHAKSLLIMVVPTMAFGWFVSAAFIHLLFPKLDFVSSLVISACLTPTDPIISAAVIGGKFAVTNVPLSIRQLLVAESAANDGLAYPFLSIAIYLTTEASRATAFEKWIVISWLYQVVLGTVLGAIIGYLFSRIMRFSQEKGFLDRESYIAQFISLALFTAGATNSLGNDDLLAAFAAGCAVSWDGYFNQQTEHDSFSSVLDLVLNCACFVYIGAWLPFDKFHISEIGVTPWRLMVLVLIILALRRIPSLLLLYKLLPEVANWREALFCGHFGPIGVGAVFIATLAQSRLEAPHDPPQTQEDLLAVAIQPIVAFVVLGSILTHGLSIPFFSIGRHTLTVTRSVVAPPDWLLWVRRAPAPQLDADRPAAPEGADNTIVVREGPQREGQKRVEWPDLTPNSSVVKTDEVILCGLSVMPAVFLTFICTSSRMVPRPPPPSRLLFKLTLP